MGLALVRASEELRADRHALGEFQDALRGEVPTIRSRWYNLMLLTDGGDVGDVRGGAPHSWRSPPGPSWY